MRAPRFGDHWLGQEWTWLGFGFLLTLTSSVGQTFFIGFFGEAIRGDFGLSHGQLGGLYTLATLIAGLSMIWLGRLAEPKSLNTALILVLGGLSATAWTLAHATSPWVLFVCLLGLRLSGQGLLGHLAMTSLGRRPPQRRGQLIALAALGYPVGEALLPPLVAAALLWTDWRMIWMAIGTVSLVVALPSALWLVRRARRMAVQWDETLASNESGHRDLDRRAMVQDRRFYALLLGVLLPPFALTAVFFHQGAVREDKHWSALEVAGAYPLFALCAVGTSLTVGRLCDQVGSRPLVGMYLIPLAFGLFTLALASQPWAMVLTFGLFGMTAGAATVLQTTLWVELYGRTHLAEIRGTMLALMMIATALSPGLMGWLLDQGVVLTHLLLGGASYAGLISLGFFVFQSRLVPRAISG